MKDHLFEDAARVQATLRRLSNAVSIGVLIPGETASISVVAADAAGVIDRLIERIAEARADANTYAREADKLRAALELEAAVRRFTETHPVSVPM